MEAISIFVALWILYRYAIRDETSNYRSPEEYKRIQRENDKYFEELELRNSNKTLLIVVAVLAGFWFIFIR